MGCWRIFPPLGQRSPGASKAAAQSQGTEEAGACFELLLGSQSEGLAFCMSSGAAFGQERRAWVLVAVERAFQGSRKAEFQACGFNGAFHL